MSEEQERLNDDVNKKENKVEAEKIIKETAILKDKNSFLEGEVKLASHKIEKIEILKEKAERLQIKKDIEFMKEIEEKVKKEVKGVGSISKTLNGNSTDSSTFINEESGARQTHLGDKAG